MFELQHCQIHTFDGWMFIYRNGFTVCSDPNDIETVALLLAIVQNVSCVRTDVFVDNYLPVSFISAYSKPYRIDRLALWMCNAVLYF